MKFIAPSGPPQNFNIVVNVTTLFVSWEPPLPEDRNGVIISYTLSCLADGDDEVEDLSLDLNPVLEIDLYNLAPQTDYYCGITASTSVGNGPASDSIPVTTSGIYAYLLHLLFCMCDIITVTDYFTESVDALTILRWIQVGTLLGVNQTLLPATDDGFVGPIDIGTGFPFGSSVQTQVFVSCGVY